MFPGWDPDEDLWMDETDYEVRRWNAVISLVVIPLLAVVMAVWESC